LDRLSKVWAEEVLANSDGVPVLGNLLRLRLAYNEGVAFSFPLTGLALKAVTMALIAYVAYFFFRSEEHRGRKDVALAYAAILGGGIANAYDRLLIGKVTDFVDLKYFAIFNVADIMVTLGAAYVLAFHVFHDRNAK
jgi:signal peptidase II